MAASSEPGAGAGVRPVHYPPPTRGGGKAARVHRPGVAA